MEEEESQAGSWEAHGSPQQPALSREEGDCLFKIYLKNLWFSLYGGNIKLPFKINTFFLF